MSNCETCQKEFEPHPGTAGRFCTRACFYATGPRKAVVKTQRMRSGRGHPLTPPSGVLAVARMVLYDKIGPGEHPCHWCDKPVRWIVGGGPSTPDSLLADHVDWDRGNDSPENLVPSCNQCNAHRTKKGTRAPLQTAELTMLWSGVPTRAVKRYCNFCGSDFLTVPANLAGGRGRFCSRSCARRAPTTSPTQGATR